MQISNYLCYIAKWDAAYSRDFWNWVHWIHVREQSPSSFCQQQWHFRNQNKSSESKERKIIPAVSLTPSFKKKQETNKPSPIPQHTKNTTNFTNSTKRRCNAHVFSYSFRVVHGFRHSKKVPALFQIKDLKPPCWRIQFICKWLKRSPQHGQVLLFCPFSRHLQTFQMHSENRSNYIAHKNPLQFSPAFESVMSFAEFN